MSAKGGITEGKSHAEGGIPMVVKSTGQQVELEGGEGVINKRNMASTKTFEFEGKEKTICEIASEINSTDGNGVQIDCDNVTGKKYKYAKGGKILNEYQEEQFQEWLKDGNVIEREKGVYSTQDAQYRNRIQGMDGLRKYVLKEFYSDSYAKGGWLLVNTDTERTIGEYETESEARQMMYEYDGDSFVIKKSELEKEKLKETYRPPAPLNPASYIGMERGGGVKDYKSLIGKYVNIYSMGVSLPTEHQIKDVQVSGENFRYRYVTLKFDLGIAPILLDEATAFMNNEIVYVKDSKEEYGIQLVPNQFAKGGRTKNAMKTDDYENASLSMDSYEDGAISSNPTEFADGGGVDNYEMYDEQLYLDYDLKDAILENDTLSFIQERHFIRDKNGKLFMWIDWMDYDQFDKLANFLGYKYAQGGGVDNVRVIDLGKVTKVVGDYNFAKIIHYTDAENLRAIYPRGYVVYFYKADGTYIKSGLDKYFQNEYEFKDAIQYAKENVNKIDNEKFAKGGEVDGKKYYMLFNISEFEEQPMYNYTANSKQEVIDILNESYEDITKRNEIYSLKDMDESEYDSYINDDYAFVTANPKRFDKYKSVEWQKVDGKTRFYTAYADINYFDEEGEYRKYHTSNHIKAESKEKAKMIFLRFIENAIGKNEWEWEDEEIDIRIAQSSDEFIEFKGYLSANNFGGLTRDKFSEGRFENGGDVKENNYQISISENDKYIGEYPDAIVTLGEAKSIFVQLETKYRRPQYLISVYKRPTSSSGFEKINVDEWYAYAENFEKGGDVRDFEWYQMWKKDQVKKGTAHEMEHIDTIREFKKRGVSDKEVAQAIAQDHLEEDENYYIELEKMEEKAKQVDDTLTEHEKHKNRKKNIKRFRLGGYMGYRGEMVYIKMKEDVTTDLFNLEGRFYSETTFKKDALIMMSFISNNGFSSKMEIMDTGVYAVIPNVAFELVGYDSKKYGKGGDVKPQFSSVDLSENDKEILSVLRTLNEENATHEQKEFISNFRGENVVNQLSKQVISKIYGLLFEWHNIENPIHNVLIENVGAGNIASLLPNSLVKKIGIEFSKDNMYYLIEKKINSIVNSSMTFYDMSSYDLKSLDAIIKVYEKTNPLNDTLVKRLYQSDNKAVAVGVAEFTSEKHLNEFKNSVGINMGGFAQNQMFLAKSMNYFIVNEGITDEGKHTLIYGVTKY